MKFTVLFLSRTVFRAWIVFAAMLLLGVAVDVFLDSDSLRSDDPYIVGLVFGTVGASMAGVYCLLELFSLSRIKTGLLYFLVVGAWCLFMFICSRNVHNGEGVGEFLLDGAVASAMIGVAVWPLCMKKLPRYGVLRISAAGIFLLLMYAFVLWRYY